MKNPMVKRGHPNLTMISPTKVIFNQPKSGFHQRIMIHGNEVVQNHLVLVILVVVMGTPLGSIDGNKKGYGALFDVPCAIISQWFLLKLLNEGTFFSGLKASGPTVSTMEAMAHLSP